MAKVSKRNWTYKGEQRSAWVVRFKEGGKHRSRQFDRKKEADAFRIKVEGMEASGGGLIDSTVTVEVVCDEFLTAQKMRRDDGRIGEGRYRGIYNSISRHIVPIIGQRNMSDLTGADVEKFYEAACRKNLSPRTARDHVYNLRLICAFAERRGYAHRNAAKDAAPSLRGIVNKPIRTFNPSEVRQLLKVASEKRYRTTDRNHDLEECFVNLAAFCGLRLGEITGLKVDNIDFHRSLIRVRHSLTLYGEHKGPKTRAGVRDVPMPPHVAKLLRNWLDRWAMKNSLGLAFCTRNGTPVPQEAFRVNCWKHLLRRAGLVGDGEKMFHFHALRHFCASWMVTNQLPITEVSRLLGHESFDMTLQVYAHPVWEANEQLGAVTAMSNRLIEAE